MLWVSGRNDWNRKVTAPWLHTFFSSQLISNKNNNKIESHQVYGCGVFRRADIFLGSKELHGLMIRTPIWGRDALTGSRDVLGKAWGPRAFASPTWVSRWLWNGCHMAMELSPRLCLLQGIERKPLQTKHTLVLSMSHALKVNCFNFNMLRIDGAGEQKFFY